jgi:hypothetical protein
VIFVRRSPDSLCVIRTNCGDMPDLHGVSQFDIL